MKAGKLDTDVKQKGDCEVKNNIKSCNSSEEQTSDILNGVVIKSSSADLTDSGIEETLFPKQCHVCKEMFENMKTFSKHIKTHNVKPKGRRRSKQDVWPCCVCGRELTTAVRQACHHYSKHGIPYDASLRLHPCDVEVCS